AVGNENVARHMLIITEPGDNSLRRLGTDWSLQALDHNPGIGGRFSVLSLVGLLPAMIAGLDAYAIRAGAAQVLDNALASTEPAQCPPAVGAALSMALLWERGTAITVIMPYVDRLASFGAWYQQLWAESLGKDGKGTTPIRAVGTTDQHSQLQLYLDGPHDKMFTLLLLDVAGSGGDIGGGGDNDPSLAYLKDHTLGDLMDVEQRATAATLAANGCPTRIIALDRLDEKVLGGLLMHFMLETMIAAHLLGVDAFDQPAVEQGKVLARDYLAKMGKPA
ncbi:MAG TPA: glucose-6-phosphate isomerase, partial [Rhodospirillales bacterium]|nr:glucose-6-phosphate isomerase [Rhodospirillales bacterium]